MVMMMMVMMLVMMIVVVKFDQNRINKSDISSPRYRFYPVSKLGGF